VHDANRQADQSQVLTRFSNVRPQNSGQGKKELQQASTAAPTPFQFGLHSPDDGVNQQNIIELQMFNKGLETSP